MKLIRKLKNAWREYFPPASYSRCYSRMEREGIAGRNHCCGLVGGDAASGFVQYGCLSCPFLMMIEEHK